MTMSIRGIILGLTTGLVAATLAKEFRTPTAARTWHGTVAGLVPYDFRVPTWRRFQEAMWNPNDDRIFTPMTFGLGWTINWRALARLLVRR